VAEPVTLAFRETEPRGTCIQETLNGCATRLPAQENPGGI